MAAQLQNINLIAPGFKGLNTEDSPLQQDPSFAEIADNAVIDQRGRIAARNGYVLNTASSTPLSGDRLYTIHEFYDSTGASVVFSCGNEEIFTGTSTLTVATPAAYTIASGNNNWKIVNFNDKAYFFHQGQEPLVYETGVGLVTYSTALGTACPAYLYTDEALAAFGRLWVVGSTGDSTTIYWSDLLDGTDFTGGSSGSINLNLVWPDGYDEVSALAAFNNNLIIFGNHSIVVYAGAESPATMVLADTVAGIGCIFRDSVQHIGTDILFVSQEGLRSFGRAIQEKALPISDLSKNVRSEILEAIRSRSASDVPVSVFSPENSFYLLCFPGESVVYCFDIRGTLENGSYRVTKWPNAHFKAFTRERDGDLLVGTTDGIGTYGGYLDNASPYKFTYRSPELSFGDSSLLKMVKKIKLTVVGGSGVTGTVTWEYDFTGTGGLASFPITAGAVAYYNEGFEFEDPSNPSGGGTPNTGEYTTGRVTTRKSINGSGSGEVVNIGFNVNINGVEMSIQEINVLATLGRMG